MPYKLKKQQQNIALFQGESICCLEKVLYGNLQIVSELQENKFPFHWNKFTVLLEKQ